MKLKNIFFIMLCMLTAVGFVSCDDDDDVTSTHTDASLLVNGTFKGTIVDKDGVVKAEDVEVTLTRFEGENVQATTFHLTAPSISMDQTAVFNVACAGDNRYTFSSGSVVTATGEAIRNSGAILEGDELTVMVTMNSKYKFSTASAAKPYTIKAVKVAQ